MEKEKRVWTKWLYWFTFAVAVIFVYKALDNFSNIFDWVKTLLSVLMPFLMGIFLAYLFYTPCVKVENRYTKSKSKFIKKKARMLSIATVYAIALLLIVLIINFVLPTITESVTDLFSNIDEYYKIATEAIKQLPEDSVFHSLDVQKIFDMISQIKIEEFLNFDTVVEYAKGAIGVATSIFDAFVSLIVSIYILMERKEILRFLRKAARAILTPNTYGHVEKYFRSGNAIFFNFLSSQLIDAIVVGVIVSIAMLLLGVKYAVLLGFIIGISNLIPYFGAIIGVGVSILITVFTGGIGKALTMAIVVIVLQQIDANIINPKIVGNSLKISPLLVIFAVTIGGAYFGILGMFLAVPVFTVIKKIVEELIENKLEKEDA